MRKYGFSFLTGSLVAGLQVSACSGLAFALALMSPVAKAANEQNILMTPALFELSCLSGPVSPSLNQAHQEKVGCSDAEECIQSTIIADVQVSRPFAHIRTAPGTLTPVLHAILSHTIPRKIPVATAREGPYYETAIHTSHELVKRE